MRSVPGGIQTKRLLCAQPSPGTWAMSVREKQAHGTVFTRRTFCLGKQEGPADNMLQTVTQASVFLQRLRKGVRSPWQLPDHRLGPLPRNEVRGLSRPAEGQSQECMRCPVSGFPPHPGAGQERGCIDTQGSYCVSSQGVLLCELTVSSLALVCVR